MEEGKKKGKKKKKGRKERKGVRRVYICNPDYVRKCEFRLKDGRCTFEGLCNQKMLKSARL